MGDFVPYFIYYEFSMGDFVPGGFCLGDFVHGGFCPGGFCPGTEAGTNFKAVTSIFPQHLMLRQDVDKGVQSQGTCSFFNGKVDLTP